MTEEKIIECVDVIARVDVRYVIVVRYTVPRGFAFPGGKVEPGESPEDAARREFFEETGLALAVEGFLGRYDAPDRDPRGRYVSNVFFGTAEGNPKPESGKTSVVLRTPLGIHAAKAAFIADHYQMFSDYLLGKTT